MSLQRLSYQNLFWRGCNFLTAFLLNLLLARCFGPVLSGQLNYFVAIISFAVLAGSLNLDATLTYFSADHKTPLNQLLSLVMIWLILVGGILWIISGWLTTDYFSIGGPGLDLNVLLFMLGSMISVYFASLFYGRKDFRIPNMLIAIFNILQLIILYLMSFGEVGIRLFSDYLPYYFSLILAQGVLLAAIFLIKYGMSIRFTLPQLPVIRKILRYTFTILLTNLLVFLLYRVDYWMLVRFDDSANRLSQLGNYIQASKLGNMFILVSSTLGTVVFANTASAPDRAEIGELCKMIRGLLIFGLIAFVVIAATGSFLIPWIYGVRFDNIYPCLLLIMPGILAIMTISICANYLSGSGRTRYNLIGVLIGLLVILAGDALLIPIYGIYGAAAVSSLGYLAYAAYVLTAFLKFTNSGIRDVFGIRKADLGYFKWVFGGSSSKNKIG